MRLFWLAKVLAVDGLLLLGAYAVLGDVSSRVGYAQREGLSFTFAYSLFIKTSDLSGRGSQLVSPPTLDWIQVLVLVAVVANVLFLAELVGERRERRRLAQQQPPA